MLNSYPKKAEEKLGCRVNFNVVWKKCEDIHALRSEFSCLNTTKSVLYSFWTCWKATAKEALLALVGAESNILALAIFIKRGEKNSIGFPFNVEYILDALHKSSSNSTWTVFTKIDHCRFIGEGSETATAVVFQRVQTYTSDASKDDGQWVDMCLQCGGGGGGYSSLIEPLFHRRIC